MRRLRTAAALTTALAASLVLAACGGTAGGAAPADASHTPDPDKPQVLKWAIDFPASWDPVVSGSGAQFRILSLAYASLTEIDEDGVAQPGLAESWDYNETGDEVTFHLRPGLTFSDDTPLDAEAVKLYLERAKSQENSALDGDLGSIASVDAASPTDVVVHLTQTDYQLPLLLGQRVAQITSPTAAKDPAKLTTWPVGAGPFVVKELVTGSHAVLVKNPDYWDAENIEIDEVDLSAVPDPATVVSGIQTGVFDFAYLSPSQVKAAEAAGLDVVKQPGYNAANISLNVNKPPFDDPSVVDAVRYAIDRQEFVDKVTFGTGSTTAEPFPAGYIAYDEKSADLWPYDPDKSKSLLAQAGHANDISVDLVIPAESPAAEIVQSQLAAVGITVNIKVDTAWATPFFAKELALSLYGTTGRESPVQTLTAHFGPQGPLNLSSPYTPTAFADAVAVARETPLDSPDYAKNLQAATRAGLESQALVFTYSQPNIFVKSPRVSDLPAIPGQVHWTGVTVSEK